MTTTNDHLEDKLKELYAHVPAPPGELAAGRERLLAEAARWQARAGSSPLPTGQAAGTQKNQRRRKMKLFLAYKIITAVMALVMGTTAAGGGVVLAAADTLPGDALYPVKLIVEDTRLALTADPAAQAGLTLSFAAERAEEMQRLLAQGEPVPEEAVARMAQHTEQVMVQIAQARPEEVPALLERVMERTRAQQQVLQQVRAAAPEEAQTALRRALEVTERAYQTASVGLEDPERFQNEYQYQYHLTPGPHGQATPSVTPTGPCETCTPQQDRDRDRDRDQDRIGAPTGTPEPCQTCTPEQEREREREREQDQTCTPEATHTPEQEREREREQERNQTQAPEPTVTAQPTDTPEPTPTPRRTHTPQPGPTHSPMPTHTPGEGKGPGGG